MKLFYQIFSFFILFPTISLSTPLLANDISAYSPVIIKSTTNRNEPNNGDYFIANDLATGFSSLGILTDIDYRNEYQRPHSPSPKVSIYMRGYTKFHSPFDPGINILYVYYPLAYTKNSKHSIQKSILNSRLPMPPNANLDDDLKNFDIIAVASPTYTNILQKNGINAVYIPQFVNEEKFFYSPQENLKTDILFVGSNWHDRTSLRYALEAGFEVSVYGYHWQDIIPPKMYKGTYIQNNILNQYYSSAKIVLNDHRPDMKELGFINNRIFDATATGTLVISDYMPEIQDIYKDCIPMYKTKEELSQLLTYYLNNETERQNKAKCAQSITLQKFTNKTIAKQILTIINQQTKKVTD